MRKFHFIYDGEVERRIWIIAEGKESPLGGQLE